MLYYLYDGTFPGLLTALYEAKHHKLIPDKIVPENCFEADLFGEYIHIQSDDYKAAQLITSIKKKITKAALINIIYCFLSEHYNAGTLIYYYLEAGWEKGIHLDHFLTDDRIFPLHDMVQKVKKESYRMLGLIRFKLVHNNFYYACIEPDHNILGLIASHFTRRLSDQKWIIHDIKRGIAAKYDGRDWDIVAIEVMHQPEMHNEEIFYQNLWKEYFKNITITERKNERLQKQFMPKRYWKHLIEKS